MSDFTFGYRRAARSDIARHRDGARFCFNRYHRSYYVYCYWNNEPPFPPALSMVFGAVQQYARSSSVYSARMMRNGLRALFVKLYADDVTQDFYFDSYPDGSLRLAPKRPISVSLFRKFFAPLGRDPLDRRDRAMQGLIVSGVMSHEAARGLRVHDIRFTEGGALIFTAHPIASFVHLRAHEHGPCLVRWLREWLEWYRPDAESCLFPGRDQRGALRSTPMSGVLSGYVFRSLVERSGIDPRRYGTAQLRTHFTYPSVYPL